MSSIIQGANHNPALIQGTQPVHSTQQLSNQYKGQTVTLAPTSHLQAILSAAEEATMQASEKAEKKLSNRKAQDKGTRIPISVKRIQEYLDKIPDLEKHKSIKDYADNLLKNPNLAYENFKRFNSKKGKSDAVFSDDPTLQFAALNILKDSVENQPELENLTREINTAIENLLLESEAEINAGMNISQIAHQHANSLEAQSLRDTYRDSVLDYGGLTNTYKKIIEKYGEDNFEEVRIFLLSALSSDMNALGSSIPTVKLTAINDDMFFLKVLGGMHDQCSTLTMKMKMYFQQQNIMPGKQLMTEILNLKEESWLQTNQFLKILRTMKLNENLSHQLYFLTELHKLLRLMPIKAYDTAEDRDLLLATSQEALDELIQNLNQKKQVSE